MSQTPSVSYGRSLLWRPMSLKRIRRYLEDIARLRRVDCKRVRVVEVCNGTTLYAVSLSRWFSTMVIEPDKHSLLHMMIKFTGSDVPCKQTEPHNLPLTNYYVDMVILHADGESGKFEETCSEAYRVLRPGGILCVVNTEPAQLADGFWYSRFYPQALISALGSHLSNATIVNAVYTAGFRNIMVHTPHHPLIVPEYYARPDVVCSKWYQDADLIMRWASEEERNQANEDIDNKARDGELDSYIQAHTSVHNSQVSLAFGFIPFMH